MFKCQIHVLYMYMHMYVRKRMVLPAGWDKVRAKGEFEPLHSTWLIGQFSVQLRTCVPCLGEGYSYSEVSTMRAWGKSIGTLDRVWVGHNVHTG